MAEEHKPIVSDLFGAKAYGEALKVVVEKGFEGASAFLGKICMPAAEELGLYFQDKLRYWRLKNVIEIMNKAEGMLDFTDNKLQLHPRVAHEVMENGSLCDDTLMQEMWAGLLAASCKSREEDENIIFVDILKRLTSSQVKLLNHLCENATKTIDIINLPLIKESGLVSAVAMKIEYQQISEIMQTYSELKVDTELSALENMGLLEIAIKNGQLSIAYQLKSKPNSTIRPTLISLLLYIKCKGSSVHPFDYFLIDIVKMYSNLLKGYISLPEENILDHIYSLALEGSKYDKIIESNGITINIKDPQWKKLSEDAMVERLRCFVVFRHITGISNKYILKINQDDRGTFTVKDGIERPYKNQ